MYKVKVTAEYQGVPVEIFGGAGGGGPGLAICHSVTDGE